MSSETRSLLIVFGNQLFPDIEIEKSGCRQILMVEDFDDLNDCKYHKLRILMIITSMRRYRDDLTSKGYEVHYRSLDDHDRSEPFEAKLAKVIEERSVSRVVYFEVEDRALERRLEAFKDRVAIPFEELTSPMFLCSRERFSDYVGQAKALRMTSFYQMIRADFNVLLDDEQKPVGGRWSYDADNRKRLPKDKMLPGVPVANPDNKMDSLKLKILESFSDHPGEIDNLWMPTARAEALAWLDRFLELKLEDFGAYEDAIVSTNNFVFHSAISPMLNLGLLTPKEVLEKTLQFHSKNPVALNSLEGFLRQVIGWREFIRGVNRTKGEQQLKSNFWGHTGKLDSSWYEGNTGIVPLDDTIKDCLKFGYTHHIPRLMIVANLMTLARIHPDEIYRWFMEMFVDSAEWVMVPNVYGMGTFADGGLFATKPYCCGSNYILKMSNYKKGSWCDVVDGLYWLFISDNEGFFKKNPRLSMMTIALGRISEERKNDIFSRARDFISERSS